MAEIKIKMKMKIDKQNLNITLLAISILAPATSLTLKLVIDLLIICTFISYNQVKIEINHIIIFFLFFVILSFQDLYSKQLNNIFEIGRLLSAWLIFSICRKMQNIHVLISFLKNIMILAGIVTLLNYWVISDIMVSYGFNNLSFNEAYGRNSSIFATFNAIGCLCFLTLHLVFRSSIMDLRTILAVLSALMCLFTSGSKTYMLLVIIYISIFIIIYYFQSLSMKITLIYTVSIIGIFYSSDLIFELGKFQVAYQIEKLLSFLQGNIPTSVLARFDHWENFLALSGISLFYLILGVPKEVTDNIGNTFDSDSIFILVRFGIPIFILYLSLICTVLVVFIKRFQFLDFLFFSLLFIGSLTLGVMSDVQSAALILMFLCMVVGRYEKIEK